MSSSSKSQQAAAAAAKSTTTTSKNATNTNVKEKNNSNSNSNSDELSSMRKMLSMQVDVDGGGKKKSIWTATLETFGMADGHHHKDDIVIDLSSSTDEANKALELIREYAESKVSQGKYDWNLVPFEGFPKSTRDDLLLSFLSWATKEDGKCNINKAARRLDAYFEWMKDNREEIYGSFGPNSTAAPTSDKNKKEDGDDKNNPNQQHSRRLLTFQSIEAAAKIWDIQITYDDQQKFVWWIDLGKLMTVDNDDDDDDKKDDKDNNDDHGSGNTNGSNTSKSTKKKKKKTTTKEKKKKASGNAIKSLDPNEHLRYVVWFAHLVMFDEHARKNGAIIVEDLAHIGFWALATLLPHDLSAKMDRLTIGILPVKMKGIYVFGAAGWMNLLMTLMKPFMSKKMRDRMQLVSSCKTRQDMQTYCENLVGGKANIPSGFCGLEGGARRDSVIEQFIH